MTGPAEHPVVALAGQALKAAMDGDEAAAAEAVEQIDRDHKPDGILVAVLAWCDTLVLRWPGAGLDGAPGPDAVVKPTWFDAEAGQIRRPEEVAAPALWAGRLLAARAVMDHDACKALFMAVPEDQAGEHVMAMLYIAAANLRAILAGRHPNQVTQQ